MIQVISLSNIWESKHTLNCPHTLADPNPKYSKLLMLQENEFQENFQQTILPHYSLMNFTVGFLNKC